MLGTRRGWTRWYHCVGYGLTAYLLGVGAGAVVIGQKPGWTYHDDWALPALVIATMVGLVLGVGWLSLVLPILEAADRTTQWHRTPRAILMGHRVMLFLVPIGVAFSGVAYLLMLLYARLVEDRPHVTNDFGYAFVLFGVAVLMALPILPLAWVHQRRLSSNIRARQLCYHCGYDLRATTGTHCPECGHALDKTPAVS